MHAWVRTLAVPGRGAPVFVLHDEYASWPEMVRTVVSNMARNGQSQLSVAEVGVSPESDPSSLLREFDGLQYFGVFLVPEEGAHGQAAAERYRQYQLATERVAAFSSRAVLRFTS